MMAVWSEVKGIDCRSCNNQIREYRGCERPGMARMIEELDMVVDRCPRRLVAESTAVFLEAFTEYTRGRYPNAGGYLDQPIKYKQAMAVIADSFAIFGRDANDGK